MKERIEIEEDKLEVRIKRVLAHPMYNFNYDGTMHYHREIALIRHIVPQRPSEFSDFSVKDASSFFPLSQKCGFSKHYLRDMYRNWTAVTRHDMTPSTFIPWMKTIGFKNPHVSKRIFEAFDEDNGGTLSFPEAAIGLSFILRRDIRMPQFKLERDDTYLHKLIFVVLDVSNNGLLSRFEMYQFLNRTLMCKSKETNKIMDILWTKAFGHPGCKDEMGLRVFSTLLKDNPAVWRFFRRIMMLQGIDPATRKYEHLRDDANKILMMGDEAETDEDEDLAHGGTIEEEAAMRIEAQKEMAERRARDADLLQKRGGARRMSVTEMDVGEASKYFEEEELSLYAKAFNGCDVDQSGHICKEEMAVLLQDIGEAPESPEELDLVMAQFDKNGDGQMGYTEFLQVIRITQTKQKKTDADEMVAAFGAMDQDGSGELTKEELKEAMASMGAAFTDKQMDEMFRDADEDESGTIDYREFAAIMAQ